MSPDPKVEPAPELVVEAQKLLDAAGVRMFTVEGEIAIGIWGDTDAPVLRHALRVMGLHGYPIRIWKVATFRCGINSASARCARKASRG